MTRSAARSDTRDANVTEATALRLRHLLDGLVERRGIEHAVIHVATGDGSFAWSAGAGAATVDGAPMTPTRPYPIASVTKLYTAAVTLRLVEDGVVDLEAPIVSYLPDEYASGLHRLRGVDHTARISVRNLLAHTSGLPNYFEDKERGGKSLSERLFSEGDRAFGDADALARTKELSAHFEPQPARARRVRYSDTNYWLLGTIIETTMGMSLEGAYEQVLFRPLGLRQTSVYGRTEPSDDLDAPASLWVGDRPMAFPKFMRSHTADGGLVATSGDTIAFMRALVRGDLFRMPATFEAMTAHLHRFGFPTDAAAVRAPSWPIECGLGIFRFQLPRLFTGFWPMPALIGHTGSTRSWLFYCPAWDAYLAGTVDQVTAGAVPYRLMPKLLQAIEPAVARP